MSVTGDAERLPQRITQAHCNCCGIATNHDVIAAETQDSSDDNEMPIYDLYEMLRCRGCNTIALRHTVQYGRNGVGGSITEYHPPAVSRRMPRWVTPKPDSYDLVSSAESSPTPKVPFPVRNLIREVYVAFQNNSLSLPAMGVRATLEHVMIDKVGDNGSFKANLDAFESAGYLSRRQRGHLEAVLDAGNATIHRAWVPTDLDVVVLLDIAESVIEAAYLHDELTDTLSRKIPPRTSRPARKSE
jgi:Domain of unknown function (DUF4145)